MQKRTVWMWVLVVAAALFVVACGSDEGSADAGASDGGTTADGTTDGDVGDEPTPPQCTAPDADDYLSVFGYRWRVFGIPPSEGKSEFDLFMMRPEQKDEPVNLTQFLPQLTCEFGCLIDDSFRFIAINDSPPDQNGLFDFQIGLFNDCLDVALKGLTFEDKAHFAFAGDYIYFSERKSCNGPSCQYSVTRVNLNDPTDTAVLIPFFPPEDDPDWVNGDSTFKGRFRVSPDGESLVMLSPTIRSQRIYLWNSGALHEVDYLCANFQNDTCIGAGSDYSDNDPVAISPDSKQIVVFTTTARALQIRRYSTENVDDKGSLTLLSVPPEAGAYNELACAYRQPWQYTDVDAQPVFTPDGSKLVFVGRADCTAGADKVETDVLWIDPARIDELRPLEEHDLFNVTNNPKTQGPGNNEIASVSVSPNGAEVLFTATPLLTSNWQPIKDTDDRHRTDKELFSVSICGGNATQLTSDVSFSASTPRAMSRPAGLSSCPGHPLAE